MLLKQSLSVDQLYQICDLTQYDFDTMAELDTLAKLLEQEGALEAIEFNDKRGL